MHTDRVAVAQPVTPATVVQVVQVELTIMQELMVLAAVLVVEQVLLMPLTQVAVVGLAYTVKALTVLVVLPETE
jgi:hypothetical protein